jgi:hypothetical protein
MYVLTQNLWLGIISVLHTEDYPDFSQMIDTTVKLLDEYGITYEGRHECLLMALFLQISGPEEKAREILTMSIRLHTSKSHILVFMIGSSYSKI